MAPWGMNIETEPVQLESLFKTMFWWLKASTLISWFQPGPQQSTSIWPKYHIMGSFHEAHLAKIKHLTTMATYLVETQSALS